MRTLGRHCCVGDVLPFDPAEGDWKDGRRLAAVFPGDLHHCERDGDDLKIFRKRSHEIDDKPVHVASFHGPNFEPATDEQNQLGIYELDPNALPQVRSHDRPRTLVSGSARDGRRQLQAIQRRNDEFWKEQQKK